MDKKTLTLLTKLCRIDCSEEESERLLENLKSILGYVDQMKEVDTHGISECNHVSEEVESFMHEDDPKEQFDRKKFLDNSPSHVGGMVRVPTIIKF